MSESEVFEDEVWKDVVGLEEFFEVSNLSRVRSKTNQISKQGHLVMFAGKIIHDPETHMKNRKPETYFKINLRNYETGVVKNYRVHRIVCEAFHKKCEERVYINHIDGNKWNNKASNLEWVTPSENTIHAINTGLIKMKRGSSSSKSPFNSEQAYLMFDALFKGLCSCKDLGVFFNVSSGYASLLLQGRRMVDEYEEYSKQFNTDLCEVKNLIKKRRTSNFDNINSKVMDLYKMNGDLLRLNYEH